MVGMWGYGIMSSHFLLLLYVCAQKLVILNHSISNTSSSSYNLECQVQSGDSRLLCRPECSSNSSSSSINKITVVATVPNVIHHYANAHCRNLEQHMPSHLPLLHTINLLVRWRLMTVLQIVLSATQRYDRVQERSMHSQIMLQPIFSLQVS